ASPPDRRGAVELVRLRRHERVLALSASRMTPPFARRLHFVAGKGGVGKTTVAAALARTFAESGRRTLAIEMDTGGRLAAMLDAKASIGTPTQVAPNLSVASI